MNIWQAAAYQEAVNDPEQQAAFAATRARGEAIETTLKIQGGVALAAPVIAVTAAYTAPIAISALQTAGAASTATTFAVTGGGTGALTVGGTTVGGTLGGISGIGGLTWAEIAAGTRLINTAAILANEVAASASKEKEEKIEYETFYRAMSNKEYEITGGLLQHRLNEKGEYKGAGPFITDRLDYALSTQEFGTGKYDMIIEYNVPKGTRAYLTSISLKHPMDNITKNAINEVLPVMKLEKQGYNFGFPGQSGNLHFNNKIMSMKKINFK